MGDLPSPSFFQIDPNTGNITLRNSPKSDGLESTSYSVRVSRITFLLHTGTCNEKKQKSLIYRSGIIKEKAKGAYANKAENWCVWVLLTADLDYL